MAHVKYIYQVFRVEDNFHNWYFKKIFKKIHEKPFEKNLEKKRIKNAESLLPCSLKNIFLKKISSNFQKYTINIFCLPHPRISEFLLFLILIRLLICNKFWATHGWLFLTPDLDHHCPPSSLVRLTS